MGGPSPPLKPRAREILDVARDVLDREGAAGLSMRRIAERVGIRAPSLYNHFPDKRSLEAALITDGFAEWADRFEAASGDESPLAVFAREYRSFARENPHLYRLMTNRPLPRDHIDSKIEARAARPAILAAGHNPDRARALWAFAHGMAILELNQRFPDDADLDAAWKQGTQAFGLSHQA